MPNHSQARAFRRVGLLALVLALIPTGHAAAQDSALPHPRLLILTPPGGKAGTTVEVTFTGTDLEDPERLVFSAPGIKAEPVIPPAPPADPKKPMPMPAAKPAVTKFKVTIPADTPLGIHDALHVGKLRMSKNVESIPFANFISSFTVFHRAVQPIRQDPSGIGQGGFRFCHRQVASPASGP